MEVWDSEREKRLDSVHVKSEDFIHLIEQLIAYACYLSETRPKGAREVDPLDTVPGGLAKGLVSPLGYKKVRHFVDVHDNREF